MARIRPRVMSLKKNFVLLERKRVSFKILKSTIVVRERL